MTTKNVTTKYLFFNTNFSKSFINIKLIYLFFWLLIFVSKLSMKKTLFLQVKFKISFRSIFHKVNVIKNNLFSFKSILFTLFLSHFFSTQESWLIKFYFRIYHNHTLSITYILSKLDNFITITYICITYKLNLYLSTHLYIHALYGYIYFWVIMEKS